MLIICSSHATGRKDSMHNYISKKFDIYSINQYHTYWMSNYYYYHAKLPSICIFYIRNIIAKHPIEVSFYFNYSVTNTKRRKWNTVRCQCMIEGWDQICLVAVSFWTAKIIFLFLFLFSSYLWSSILSKFLLTILVLPTKYPKIIDLLCIYPVMPYGSVRPNSGWYWYNTLYYYNNSL